LNKFPYCRARKGLCPSENLSMLRWGGMPLG